MTHVKTARLHRNTVTTAALLLAAALLALAGVLIAAAPATASAPGVTVTPTTSECWGHGRTLYRVVVFNHADHGARYEVRFQRSTSTRTVVRRHRVPAGRGVAEPVQIRDGVKLEYLEVYDAAGALVFYAVDVRGRARCSR